MIVIVDDEPLITGILKIAIEKSGSQCNNTNSDSCGSRIPQNVIAFNDIESAYNYVASNTENGTENDGSPIFEAIITDFYFDNAQRNGIDLLRFARERNLASKYILISGYDDHFVFGNYNTNELEQLGFIVFMKKPFQVSDLIEAIKA